jgi:hypothetical protein
VNSGSTGVHAWIDASAGVAGDMLLGALLDAGAAVTAAQAAVDAVVPGSVRISTEQVTRAGMRATRVLVQPTAADQPHRSWSGIRQLLAAADLADRVRQRATAVFARLAEAEARVHGIAAAEVHFHEVGALDSIADVVGVCAALEDLGVDTLSAGPVAVGSGRQRMDHGEVGVPVPAVVELARGWSVHGGGPGELATPTGVALVVTLAGSCEELPGLALTGSGVGAGSRDVAGRANVTRVLLGTLSGPATDPPPTQPAVLLEANVDDLDPRLWPGVLAALLAAGADDAWLVPIVMKKGRPAHVLSVLAAPDRAARLREAVLAETSTFGVREHRTAKYALPRAWTDVEVDGHPVAVKVAHRHGVILQVTPEFDDLASLARLVGRPLASVLTAAQQAAAAAGLAPGAPLPPAVRSTRLPRF